MVDSRRVVYAKLELRSSAHDVLLVTLISNWAWNVLFLSDCTTFRPLCVVPVAQVVVRGKIEMYINVVNV